TIPARDGEHTHYRAGQHEREADPCESLAAQWPIQRGDADGVAEAHCDERWKYVRERGAVRGDRAVVEVRIGRSSVQGTAHPHLPASKYERYGGGDGRKPEEQQA